MAVALLDSWESRLRSRIGDIDLLGEVPITDYDRDALARAFQLLVTQVDKPFELVCLAIRDLWPLTHAIFLVTQGMTSYNSGNFWTAVRDRTGLPTNGQATWGQMFLETLRKFGKPTFDEVVAEEHATRYVTPILLHSGIPDYCLNDFFQTVLHSGGRTWRGVSATDVIADWRTQRRALSTSDQPVRRFLRYGGALASDFLERCLEMARQTDEGRTLDPVLLGLPARIVERYQAYLAKLAPEQRRIRAERVPERFHRPLLHYDPWARAVEILLPEQELSADHYVGYLHWTVTGHGVQEQGRTPLRGRGELRTSEEEVIWVASPAPSYTLTLSHEGADVRRWELRGPNSRCPVLLFDPGTGQHIDVVDAVPAMRLWALVPARHRLRARTRGTTTFEVVPLFEQLPALDGGWASYTAVAIDLSHADRLRVEVPGSEEPFDIPVRPRARTLPRPILTEAEPVVRNPDDGDVYSARLPVIAIPAGHPLERWSVHITRGSGAGTEVVQRDRLVNLPFLPGNQEWSARVPLDGLLDAGEPGSYRVYVRGPLGQDAAFTVHNTPGLSLEGADRLMLPGDPGTFRVLYGDGTRLALDEDCASLRSPERVANGRIAVTVVPTPGVASVPLVLEQARIDGAIVRVPFRVSLRRFRWQILGIPEAEPHATVRVQTVDRDAFDRAALPRLLVECPVADTGIVSLSVVLRTRGQVLQQDEWHPVGASGRVPLALTPFRDSLRAAGAIPTRFDLVSRRTDASVNAFPVLTLTPSADIHDLAVAIIEEGPEQQARITWQERLQTSNRVLLFWSLRRPWEEPRHIPIPDEANQSYSLVLQPALAAGNYRAALVVEDPWTGLIDTRLPASGAVQTAEVQVHRADTARSDESEDDGLERLILSPEGESWDPEAFQRIVAAIAVRSIPSRFGTDAETAAIRRCVQQPVSCARAAGELAGHLPADHAIQLLRLLMRAGAPHWGAELLKLPSAIADELGVLWPPLALAMHLRQALDGDEEAALRCRHALGPAGLDLLMPDTDDLEPVIDTRCAGLAADACRILNRAERHRPAQTSILHSWSEDLGKGILSSRVLVLAQQELSANLDRERELWAAQRAQINEWANRLRQQLQLVSNRKLSNTKFVNALHERFDEQQSLRNIGFISGCAALMEQLRVWQPQTRAFDVSVVSVKLFELAPLHFTRDLCLAAVALALD